MKLLNSFSLNMLAEFPVQPLIEEITLSDAKARLEGNLESAVGHSDTAAIFADQLGMPVPSNRMTVSLAKGDMAVIGQYRGPRLAEGVTTLPEGASIVWYQVTVK
jgi:hypothetical protein